MSKDLVGSLARGAVGRPVIGKDGRRVGTITDTMVDGNKVVAKIRMDDGTEYQSIIAQVDEIQD